jgi:tryptophan 2,3-dioxygenase
MDKDILLKMIVEKYERIGENPEVYLKGLLHSKPLNYWDYIETETLLSLQKTKTNYNDEISFILYNQIAELIFKLILTEVKQITGNCNPSEAILIDKIGRINNYTKQLISFFGIMKDGLNYDDYNSFRFALAPASGFQSCQFREIELYCTSLENLIGNEGKKQLSVNPSIEECFEHIYWREAGVNHATGERTYTLQQFEEKYMERFIALAKNVKGNTLEDKICRLQNLSGELQDVLREFDKLYNIDWPLVHLSIANHFLSKKGSNTASTGNSNWNKYLHPESQQRRFFPSMWSNSERANRGNKKS